MDEAIQQFFLSPLADQAAASLSNTACIALHIENKKYFFMRQRGKNCLLSKAPAIAPDISFWISNVTMRQLIELENGKEASLGRLGAAIFDALLSSDPKRKVKLKIHGSFFQLFRKGYFSILKAGGPEVASYMAKIGFGSLAQVQALWRKFRGE